MQKRSSNHAIAVLAVLGLFVCALPAHAADGKPIATVDGAAIGEAYLAIAEKDVGGTLGQIPDARKRRVLTDYLVDLKLFAAAARKAGLDKTPEFQRRMAYTREKELRDAFIETEISKNISDAVVRAFYDKEIGSKKSEEEVRARHILVDTEEKARDIVEKLARGADFIELAKEESKGPSGAQGGDLGYFTKERMVPEFSKVAFALKKGDVSEPVKSQFGWHVIMLEDRRTVKKPSFESTKDRIRNLLEQRKFGQVRDEMRKAAKIERPEENGKAEK